VNLPHAAILAAVLLCLPASHAQDESAGGPFADAIDIARSRVVKLYGSGFGREHGYGSGVLVSGDGRIVTTLSVLLESPAVRAVLPDGRRFPAEVIKRDEEAQIALLKIDAADLPYFELADSSELQPGDWLIAAANTFKIADGPEPISVSVGVFSGRTELSARRRTQDFTYRGEVLLTDLIVATPGSAGGALVDARGGFVGLIGKAVTSKRTNTWINYALPSERVAAFLNERSDVEDAAASEQPAAGDATRPDLGIVLFDIGGRERPAYVERVRPDSPAHVAGVRSNDLILSLDGDATETCERFQAVRDRLRVGREVAIVIKRGDDLRTLTLTVGGRER